ncbi:nucleotide-binding protein [Variovorax saccharolyticus]|uniref:nucleotide-binding protein n=1 Tax=Variovorax saccharolyticus TaxID=3053516 RepID=UPI002576EFBD|nr:conjugal transfer protein TraL [Variovorax sp. J31P216]MDM0029144.1 conjugal transfer protein TraL [Variovorax sp. J31P216]
MPVKEEKSTPQGRAVHLTLQGKGGVGKSFVSAVLAQYFLDSGKTTVTCLDTDPVNQTFVNYKALNAEHVKLLEGAQINERNFDALMERLLSEDGVFIVDNGSSSFVPLSNYLIENDAFRMLREAGREVVIHTIVTGGQALLDTLSGFKSLTEQTGAGNVVVWLNEYFGPIEYEGKCFDEMRVYKENSQKVRGIVRIAKRNQDTFGRDVELMASKKLTFSEALSGPEFTIMSKQRIKTVQRDLFSQLAGLAF